MAMPRTTIPANAVRAPAVEEGTITVVTRYQDSNVKVALVHPADLEALEAAYDLLSELSMTEPLPISDLASKVQQIEDRPDPDRLVEDPREIEALLGL